jgi:dienelactone hydrolase
MQKPRSVVLFASATLALTSCAAVPAQPEYRLTVSPLVGPLGAPMDVVLAGVPPHSRVTLDAVSRDDLGRRWQSSGTFMAGDMGTVDLDRSAPQSGSYSVADGNGLMWSLEPAFAASAAQTQFYLPASGLHIEITMLVAGTAVATADVVRYADDGSVEKHALRVAQTGVSGTFYQPSHPTSTAPAILVIAGSGGGEDDFDANVLANEGYPTLALAYFGEPGLPSCLCAIPIEYFAKAAAWLRAQAVDVGRGIAVIASSRGTEAAFLLASYFPEAVDAVVAGAPTSFVYPAATGADAAWTIHGVAVPLGETIPSRTFVAPLLLVDGGEDAVWDSAESAQAIVETLERDRDPSVHTNLYYPAAGHIFVRAPVIPYAVLADGGSSQANAVALEASWKQVLIFLDSIR